MTKTFILLLITLVFTPLCHASDWRGITPLLSTRADVERLIGPPVSGTRNIYQTASERITVTYADKACDYGWRVPKDTVVSLVISPLKSFKLEEIKLDESKFIKRRDVHIETLYYYVNERDGINYTVDGGAVTVAEYYPTAKDEHLKCTVKDLVGESKTSSRPNAVVAAPDHEKHKNETQPPAQSFAKLSISDRMKELERLAPTYEYACPMHPEVRQTQEGVCPKCGMTLSTVKPSITGEYKMTLTTKPEALQVGKKARLRFVISNPVTGAPVKDYVVNHEKLFHLFIVSEDMNEYQHIHPTLERDGTFEVETLFPRPGRYKLHADFFPAGGTLQVIHRELSTVGHHAHTTPSPAVLVPDSTFGKTVDGIRISLDLGGTLVPGTLVPLKYRLTDARTGQLVRDLQPYLGAWGHTLILNADQSEYLHSHPTEMLPSGAELEKARGGPEVEFKTMFPAPGNYRIWTQFQRAGRVITVFFTVKVAG